jgi:murein DD-endopeptidase MepM/ murein hydrolase activator NlpD
VLKPTLLVRALVSIALVALNASSPTVAQTVPDPKPAFNVALPRVNALAQLGETYAIGDMRVDGNWAIAIADPVPGSAFNSIPVHNAVPMIGVYEAATSSWQIIIPTPANAAEFNALLANLPTTLMDDATRAFFERPLPRGHVGGTRAANFSGHRLPYKKGLIGYAFSKDASGHVNQVDFDIQGLASQGDVLASKAGTVVFVKESSNSGACGNFSTIWRQANMVVIEHAPGELSWYVHLAWNSVPVNVGDVVAAGTKIGIEGDTGYACGIHVHYMVSSGHTAWTNPSDPNAAPWASTNSLAPTDFDEVSWAAIQNGKTYVSQNDGQSSCPAPGLQSPADGAVVTTSIATLAWAGVSNCTFDGYRVRVKTVSDPETGGVTLYDLSEQTLSRTVTISPTWHYQDVYWSVRANGAGAPWATRKLRVEPTITGTYSLFTQTNFAGDVLTGSTTISDLASMSFDNKARSLTLDAGLSVVLCSDVTFLGDCARATGPTQIANLDVLGTGLSGTISSIRVCANACPPAPITPTITSPISPTVVLSGTPITLKWQGTGDVYQVDLNGGALTTTRTLIWTSGAQRDLGDLPASMQPYRVRVRAANAFGSSAWGEATFMVTPAQRLFVPNVLRP